MLELEQIVAGWKQYAESAPVHKHPTVWVAHFSDHDLLGALSATEPNSIGNALLFLGAPWTTVAEIREAVFVVDVFRTLHMTHFIDEGKTQRSTDWRLSYGMADDGTLEFGCAEKRPSAYWSELHLLWEGRVSKGRHDFYSAFLSAMRLGEVLL